VLVAGASVAAVLLLASGWRSVGPTGPVYAIVAHVALTCWAAVVGVPSAVLGSRWFVVGPREPAVLRVLGVRLFGRLLDLVGWNAVITRERAWDGTRAGLGELDLHTRRSEAAHLLRAGLTVPLAVAAAAVGRPGGAAWLLGTAVVVQIWPALLQRLVRSRIQRLSSR